MNKMECEKWHLCPTIESMSHLRAWVSDESAWIFYWDVAYSVQFLFLCFLKECHGMSKVDFTFIFSLLLHKCRNDWYRVLPQFLLLYSVIILNPSCPPIAVIGILLGIRSQYAVPASGTQNPQYGFLFSVLRSNTAVELRLNIDAYETPSFRLSHALSLGLQWHFKRVICPTC